MRPHGSPKQLEERRWAAIGLLKQGMKVIEVARKLGCSHSSVILWRDALKDQGPSALRAKPAPGRPPRLDEADKKKLLSILSQGATAWGFATELWTAPRIAEVIQREFHVRLHRSQVSRILVRMGWSCQKPQRRALERDDKAIEQWKKSRWPVLKKNAKDLNAHLVFLDESGFMLTPTVRRTWAPRGQTPIVRHRYRHDKISAISALSVSPQRHRVGIYACFHYDNLGHVEVAGFLRLLLRHLRGRIVLLWDGGGCHKGPEIREVLARHPRLNVERFPAYAPELNPDEFVWGHLKGTLANGRPDTVDDLMQGLCHAARGIRRRPQLLRAFFAASDLPECL